MKNRGGELQKPLRRYINLPFWHVDSTFLERDRGGIAARFAVPNRAETKTTLSTPKEDRVGGESILQSAVRYFCEVTAESEDK